MFDFNKKKISLSILLITLALISFISKIKIKGEVPIAFDDTINKNPTEWAVINFFEVFGCAFDYNNTFFVLMLFIIMSILLFIFSDDMQISKRVKSVKILVLKWDIKLIIISTLVFVFILILGKSCGNNVKRVIPKANEETPVAPDTIAAALAVPPINESSINDSINIIENKNQNNNNNKNIPSRFAEIKKEQSQTDEGISAGTGTESGVGLSFEELRSQSISNNNVSSQLLSKYLDKGEKDKIEYDKSRTKQ